MDKTRLKNVVIVAPDFTPSSYPPALRARFFAQHLPEFGWNPIVLTTDPRHYEWTVDPENEKLLDPALEVVRTGALPIQWTRKLGFGDVSLRTLWPHWRALNENLPPTWNLNLIFISVPPNFPIVLGRLTRARFGIPYILDYNDPILTDDYSKLPRAKRPPKWARCACGVSHFGAVCPETCGPDCGCCRFVHGRIIFQLSLVAREPRPHQSHLGLKPRDFEHVRANPLKNSIFNPRDGYFHIRSRRGRGAWVENVLRAFFKAIQNSAAFLIQNSSAKFEFILWAQLTRPKKKARTRFCPSLGSLESKTSWRRFRGECLTWKQSKSF